MKYVLILILSMPLFMFGSEPEGQKLQWPLKGSPKLSASFGEYRGRRFHMGIDLSTGGQEGLKVYPIADGTVFKVRATRRGYGNSIYIRHSDGKISVYAHLAEFGPKIQKALLTEKVALGTFFGERVLSVSVSQQDCIAFSGESGSGLPHLHFEIRDAANRPMDPIREGLNHLLPSRENLVIKAVKLSPLSVSSRVNGSIFPIEISDFSQPIQAFGTIGVEVFGYVLLTNQNRLGFKYIELKQDGRMLSSWNPTVLSYDFNKRGGSVFNRYFSGFSPTRYVYRFNHSKDPQLPSYSFVSMLEVEAETALSVSVGGISSNRSITINLNPKAVLRQESALSSRGHTEHIDLWHGRVRYKDPSTKKPQIRVLHPGTRLSGSFLPHNVEQLGRLPDQPNLFFQMGEWGISSSIPSQMLAVESVSSVRQGLSPVSSILMFEDCGQPVGKLSVTWKLPEGSKNIEQMGLYSWSPNKRKWRFEESVSKVKGRFDFPFFTRCVILRDTAKPILGKIKTHAYYKGRKRVIVIKDRQSGIDWGKTRLSSGGKSFAVEVDKDRSWIVLPDRIKSPIKVEVQDRAGNRAWFVYKSL